MLTGVVGLVLAKEEVAGEDSDGHVVESLLGDRTCVTKRRGKSDDLRWV